VVCDDPEFRSTLEVAAPHSECVHHSQELLFPSGIVDFRRGKASAFIGHWTTMLIEHCPETMQGGIRVHLKWLREIRESQARSSGQGLLDGLKSRSASGRPFPRHVFARKAVERRSQNGKVANELAEIGG
jgi:hypothetical protein